MSLSNEQLIEIAKAAITSGSIASSGKMNPQQADRFIDFVIDITQLKGMARVVRVRPEQLDIDKISVGARVAVAKGEGVDPGVRRGVSTSKISLTPKEIMVPFEIGDIFKEINLEQDQVEEHIVRMMATQFANDLEDLYINGNTLGPARLEGDLYGGGSSTLYIKDAYMGLTNGWLPRVTAGHVLDAENAPIGPNVLSRAINEMPDKFRRNRSMMRFFVSPDHEQAYRESVSSRMTQSGDAALNGQGNLTPFGIPLVPVPLLSSTPLVVENSVANTDGTTATALSYKPIVAGSLVLTATTLGSVPTAKYILNTDYSVDEANGTWTRLGGAIGSGATVKATYQAKGQAILTHADNLVLAIGRDIRLERDRNIFKGMNEFALTVRVDVNIEEVDASVFVKNIATE